MQNQIKGILKYNVNHFGIIVMHKNAIVIIQEITPTGNYRITCPTAIDPDYFAYLSAAAVEIILPLQNQMN